jgi:hypothetical protein
MLAAIGGDKRPLRVRCPLIASVAEFPWADECQGQSGNEIKGLLPRRFMQEFLVQPAANAVVVAGEEERDASSECTTPACRKS